MKLEDPKTIRTLWIIFWVILTVLLILDFTVEHHPHFGVDGSPVFSAWYGFFSCIVMVIVSKKIFGLILKRKDTYYDD